MLSVALVHRSSDTNAIETTDHRDSLTKQIEGTIRTDCHEPRSVHAVWVIY